MIIKLFTVTVRMKEGDPHELTEHIKDVLKMAEVLSGRGKIDFMIEKITVRRKRK